MPIDMRQKLNSILSAPQIIEMILPLCETKRVNHGWAIDLCKQIAAEITRQPELANQPSTSLRNANEIMTTVEEAMAKALSAGNTTGVCALARTAADIMGKNKGGGGEELIPKALDKSPEEIQDIIRSIAWKIGFKVEFEPLSDLASNPNLQCSSPNC